jgi:hypothetical protein
VKTNGTAGLVSLRQASPASLSQWVFPRKKRHSHNASQLHSIGRFHFDVLITYARVTHELSQRNCARAGTARSKKPWPVETLEMCLPG